MSKHKTVRIKIVENDLAKRISQAWKEGETGDLEVIRFLAANKTVEFFLEAHPDESSDNLKTALKVGYDIRPQRERRLTRLNTR